MNTKNYHENAEYDHFCRSRFSVRVRGEIDSDYYVTCVGLPSVLAFGKVRVQPVTRSRSGKTRTIVRVIDPKALHPTCLGSALHLMSCSPRLYASGPSKGSIRVCMTLDTGRSWPSLT
jgi:hypothetical protein